MKMYQEISSLMGETSLLYIYDLGNDDLKKLIRDYLSKLLHKLSLKLIKLKKKIKKNHTILSLTSVIIS